MGPSLGETLLPVSVSSAESLWIICYEVPTLDRLWLICMTGRKFKLPGIVDSLETCFARRCGGFIGYHCIETMLESCFAGLSLHTSAEGNRTWPSAIDLLHFCTVSPLGERHFPMIVYPRKLNFHPVLKPRDTIISKTLAGFFFFPPLVSMESAIHSWFSVLIFCSPGSREIPRWKES